MKTISKRGDYRLLFSLFIPDVPALGDELVLPLGLDCFCFISDGGGGGGGISLEGVYYRR